MFLTCLKLSIFSRHVSIPWICVMPQWPLSSTLREFDSIDVNRCQYGVLKHVQCGIGWHQMASDGIGTALGPSLSTSRFRSCSMSLFADCSTAKRLTSDNATRCHDLPLYMKMPIYALQLNDTICIYMSYTFIFMPNISKQS